MTQFARISVQASCEHYPLNSSGQRRMILLLAVLLSSFGRPTVTAAQTWTNSGPEGGEIVALAIESESNSTLYAGTAGGGVFKSTNAGQSWNATGLRNTSV